MAVAGLNIVASWNFLMRYIFGPKLIRIFPAKTRSAGRDFDPNNLEFLSDLFISTVSYALTLSVYASPLLAGYIYRKGMTTANHVSYLSKCLATLGASFGLAYLIRGFGRYRNPDYVRFTEVLHEAKHDMQKRALLQNYDFEFFAWPVDFRWDESDIRSEDVQESIEHNEMSYFRRTISAPFKALEYVVAHGFARRLIYPGSLKWLQNAFANQLKEGRASLIEQGAIRAKLLSKDESEIDSVFLDKRNLELNGSTLVICSEGNAGFYEVGCMTTPRIAGFSVLGWNRPGFAGSSGVPSVESEQNAIDVVIHYAVAKLGFRLDEIILFAWSIGGFPLSYAAMKYPEVKAVIVDATFDNILALAKCKMPKFASNIVEDIIENYFPLNVEKQLLRYPGPIRLIRRLQEEIITTEPFNPATNRANFLLIGILKHRYPNIMTEESINAVSDFLGAQDVIGQDDVKRTYNYDEAACENAVNEYFQGQWSRFPSDFGSHMNPDFRTQMALFLVSKYMDHFDSTHCTPLPYAYFQLPWMHD